jgi:hypothetical protein
VDAKYYDEQEYLEALGATLARQKGYDAMYFPDATAPEWTEYVGLSPKGLFRK